MNVSLTDLLKLIFILAMVSFLSFLHLSNSIAFSAPLTNNAVGCYNKSCETHVLIRTSNSGAYIEELIAFYITQGVSFIYILDYSDTRDIEKILRYYIEQHFVSYSSRDFLYDQQASEIHLFVMDLVKKYKSKDHSIWLLVLDDDEFVIPARIKLTQRRPVQDIKANENETLSNFLCRKSILKYKSVRFRWRFVGTNYIQNPEDKRGLLDIETYVRMQRPLYAQETLGKTAFHLNHKNVSISTWDSQGNNITGDINLKRKGGPYFMHGNLDLTVTSECNILKSDWLGEYALLESGFTYHFARSKSQLRARIRAWQKDSIVKVKNDFARSSKDNNKKLDFILKRWAPRVIYVLESVKKHGNLNIDTMNGIPLQAG